LRHIEKHDDWVRVAWFIELGNSRQTRDAVATDMGYTIRSEMERHVATREIVVPWPKAAMMVRRLCSVSLESSPRFSPSRFLSRKPVTGVLRST
jgi:hypothetical protein